MNFQINYDAQIKSCTHSPENSSVESYFNVVSSIPGKSFTRVELERLESIPSFNVFVLREIRLRLIPRAGEQFLEAPVANRRYYSDGLYSSHDRNGFRISFYHPQCTSMQAVISALDVMIQEYESRGL